MFQFLRKFFRRKKSKVDFLDIGEMVRKRGYDKPIAQKDTVVGSDPKRNDVPVSSDAPIVRTPGKLTVVNNPPRKPSTMKARVDDSDDTLSRTAGITTLSAMISDTTNYSPPDSGCSSSSDTSSPAGCD